MYIFKRFLGLILLAIPLCIVFYAAYKFVDIYLAIFVIAGLVSAMLYFFLTAYLLTAQKPVQEDNNARIDVLIQENAKKTSKLEKTLQEKNREIEELRNLLLDFSKNRRTKEHLVKVWKRANPEGTKQDCEKALNISRATVNKWWEA